MAETEKVQLCPYCGKEMEAGVIPNAKSRVYWVNHNDDNVKRIPLSEVPLWEAAEAEAYYCSDCRIILMPVPEIETTQEKLWKKWNELTERAKAQREERQARREEAEKEKQREKRRKNDPWED